MVEPGAEPPVIGLAVRRARERAGLSQEQLAERAGVSARSVSDIERGVSRAPRAATVASIAAALGLAPYDLTHGPAPERERAEASEPALGEGGGAPEAPEAGGFADLVRAHRRAAGFTQAQLARAALVSERAVSDLERGINRTARRDTAVLLADALALEGLQRARFLDSARGLDAGVEADADGPSRLPEPVRPIYGRDGELRDLVSSAEQNRLVTLVGPGGVGKTRLVVAAVHELARDAEVVFVAAAAATTGPALLDAIGDALGLRETGGVALDALVAERLQSVDVLVIDNLEQVIEPAATIVATLLERSSVRVIATSRVRLHLAAEHVLAVEPLASPEEVDGRDFGAGVELFLSLAATERPDWNPDPADLATIASICRRVDGLPLAIELAAAWMRMLSPAEILVRLERPLALLHSGRRDLPDRHRALGATIAGSFELLDARAQRLFARLSVLNAPFGLELAAAVGDAPAGSDLEVVADLARIADASLLRVRTGNEDATFEWLVTIRDYAAARLDESGEADATSIAFVDAMIELATTAEPHLVGPGQGAWLSRLERERDHLRAALEYCLHGREVDRATRLGAALWRYWYMAGHYTEGTSLLAAVVELLADPALAPTPATATSHYGYAVIRYLQGDVAMAESEFRHALAEYRIVGDAHGISATLSNLGMIEQYRGEFAAAHEHYAAALAEARDGRATRAAAVALGNIASLAADRGDVPLAVESYEAALAEFRALGDARAVADMSISLAELVTGTGDVDRGEELAADALATAEELDDRPGAADSLRMLGRIAGLRGATIEARERYSRGRDLSEALGDQWGVASCTSALALLHDDLDVASRDAAAALAVQRNLDHYQGLVEALLVYAEIARRRGDVAEAAATLEEASGRLAADDAIGRKRVAEATASLPASDRAGADN